MTTVDDVIAVAQQLSPVEQLEIIQSLTQILKQKYVQTTVVASASISNKRRIAGLHQGKVWMSDDFNDELPDEFWFGDDNESAA